MIVQNMSEDENHLGNEDLRSVRGPYHPGHSPRLHHDQKSDIG